MKKALLLLSALFIFGCGSSGGGVVALPGGGGSGSGSGPGTGGTNGTGTSQGVVTLNIVDGDAVPAAKSTAHQLAAVQPTVNSARIIFRNISSVTTQVPNLDANGDPDGTFSTFTQNTEIYKRVVDAAFAPGQASVQVGVPPSPARGYVVDVLTYNDDLAGHYTMSKYGRSASNIVISASGATGSITINSITPSPVFNPSTLISTDKYTLTTTPGLPLRSSYKMRQDLTDITFASFSNYSSKLLPTASFGTRTLVAPTTYADGTLYMPIQVFIDDSMLGGQKLEQFARWSMIYNASAPIIGLIAVGIPVN